MIYWIISDTHLGHQSLVDASLRAKGFEDKIINNITKSVKPEDVLIHLGDVSMGNNEYWNKLFTSVVACKKWLVKGNHDKKKANWYLDKGWDFVSEKFNLEIFGHKILFSHAPQPESDFTINIHGHLHHTNHHTEQFKNIVTKKHFLIAIENTNYAPLNLKSIVNKVNQMNN